MDERHVGLEINGDSVEKVVTKDSEFSHEQKLEMVEKFMEERMIDILSLLKLGAENTEKKQNDLNLNFSTEGYEFKIFIEAKKVENSST